jgi:hypothetical protein
LRPIRQRPADDGTGQGSTGGGASS